MLKKRGEVGPELAEVRTVLFRAKTAIDIITDLKLHEGKGCYHDGCPVSDDQQGVFYPYRRRHVSHPEIDDMLEALAEVVSWLERWK